MEGGFIFQEDSRSFHTGVVNHQQVVICIGFDGVVGIKAPGKYSSTLRGEV